MTSTPHTPTRRSPATKAMWAAHQAAADNGVTIDPAALETIAAHAIAAYLNTLADHNQITTEVRKDYMQGDDHTYTHRPVYPEDLRRAATQLGDHTTVIGPRPDNLNHNDEPRWPNDPGLADAFD